MTKEKLTQDCVICGQPFIRRRWNRPARYCSYACRRAPIETRFWWYVGDPDPVTGCRAWRGQRNIHGYGAIARHSQPYGAHRLAWEIAHGSIPAGLSVLHKCDNRACVNVDHLFLGTVQDNSDDMVQKHRQAVGAHNGFAKLTDDDVRAIRAATGLQRDIAERFGIHQTNVSLIKMRKYWKHVS